MIQPPSDIPPSHPMRLASLFVLLALAPLAGCDSGSEEPPVTPPPTPGVALSGTYAGTAGTRDQFTYAVTLTQADSVITGRGRFGVDGTEGDAGVSGTRSGNELSLTVSPVASIFERSTFDGTVLPDGESFSGRVCYLRTPQNCSSITFARVGPVP